MTTAEELVEEYVRLQQEMAGLEKKRTALEKKMAIFAKKNKIKSLITEKYMVKITQKKKTVFPLKNDMDREKLESILAESKDNSRFLDYDVVRLASAYDAKKLSPELLTSLRPLAKKKPYLRITLSNR